MDLKSISDFKNISNFELTQRLEKLVRTERKITHVILLHINEVESRKLYAELGFDGMFSYLTKGLGYSESSAYRRLQSARLLKQVPSVAEKLESGALNLSQLTQVQKCLKEEMRISGGLASQEKTEKILLNLEHKNTFETKKFLALEFNQPIQSTEILKPQADDSVRLEVTFTQEEFVELKKAKELLSHVCPEGSWSEVISALALKFNKSKMRKSVEPVVEPRSKSEIDSVNNLVRKSVNKSASKSAVNNLTIKPVNHSATNSTTKPASKSAINPPTQGFAEAQEKVSSNPQHRSYISIKTKRQLLAAANHCCQFKDSSGKCCASSYQLQVDHIIPKVLGGTDNLENLRILCRVHNILMAKKWGLQWRNE